jgi:signal transduction histidine kinase
VPRTGRMLHSAGVALAVVLPAVLLLSSYRSYRAVDTMREVFLRHRAAMIAYQLELSPQGVESLEELRASEPDLVDVETFSEPLAGGPEAASVNALFRGQTLYLTSETTVAGLPVYRVYLPVHRPALTVARLDVSAAAAGFLVRDSQRNLLLAFLAASGALLVLGAYLLATRRSLARERLAELGEMSAVLAHEIRNPLGTIKGFVQLAGEKSEPLVKSLLDPALEEIERLEKLVRDLLLFARPVKVAPELVRWEEMSGRLDAAVEDVRGAHSIALSTEPAPGLELKTDRHALHQILANLVRNAAEAQPEGGEIRVAARRDARGVTIRVEDSGPGLSEAARQRLFQPFFTTKTTGTGLGLAVSKRLARQLGGELELEAREPHGVRAVLTLRES